MSDSSSREGDSTVPTGDASSRQPDATSPASDGSVGGNDSALPSSDGSAVAQDSNLPDVDAQSSADGGTGWDTVPTILGRIVEPTFPAVDCDITTYRGVGDGTTDNTAAFAAAIAACASGGGGRVVVPTGTFLTGPIVLVSNINLYVSAGATIRFTTDATKYLPVVEVSWEGSLAYNYSPLISAHDATNVGIWNGND